LRSSLPANYEDLSCFAFAAGHGDEGVCLLIKMGPYQILLDCGLADRSALLSTDLSLVWCSHAHPDHARGLPDLHTDFPHIPIYASEVTAELLPTDCCQALPWNCPIELQEGLTAEIMPAGHLPGAAAILFTYQGAERSYSLLYTGDFFLSNSRFAEGLSLTDMRVHRPDVLIIEGSYGTARQPHRRQQENTLVEQVSQALSQHRSIGLLAPQLGQAQEIILLLRSHHLFTGRNVDLWVDEAIAEVCDRYLRCLPQLPATIQNFARNQSLFWDEKVKPRVQRLIARPGHRASGSEVVLVSDLSQLPVDMDIVLVPQQIGGEIDDRTYLLTSHSDGLGTTQLIHNLRPQHVVLIHGSPTYLSDLTGLEELNSRYQLHSPATGTLVELPIGDQFMQPTTSIGFGADGAMDAGYEGEITEELAAVVISLPHTVTTDPRWHNLADTGLVEARWQGEELVLRGITAKQLLREAYSNKVDSAIACCANCRYQRGNRCGSEDSVLYGFKVTPTGVCPAFMGLDTVDNEEL
jgi:Cft2 family RNA processing exonuclease